MYRQSTPEERYTLGTLHVQGFSQPAIAQERVSTKSVTQHRCNAIALMRRDLRCGSNLKLSLMGSILEGLRHCDIGNARDQCGKKDIAPDSARDVYFLNRDVGDLLPGIAPHLCY